MKPYQKQKQKQKQVRVAATICDLSSDGKDWGENWISGVCWLSSCLPKQQVTERFSKRTLSEKNNVDIGKSTRHISLEFIWATGCWGDGLVC